MPLASFKSRAVAFRIDGVHIGLSLAALNQPPGLLGLSAGKSVSISHEFGGAKGSLATILYFGLATWL